MISEPEYISPLRIPKFLLMGPIDALDIVIVVVVLL